MRWDGEGLTSYSRFQNSIEWDVAPTMQKHLGNIGKEGGAFGHTPKCAPDMPLIQAALWIAWRRWCGRAVLELEFISKYAYLVWLQIVFYFQLNQN